MKNKYNLDDNVYFILLNQIEIGTVSEIIITKNEIIYKIEFRDTSYKQLVESDIYSSVEELISDLQYNYDKREKKDKI